MFNLHFSDMKRTDTKDIRVVLCNRLKSIIVKRNLDIDALAVEIGVKPCSLRRVLDGRYDFSIGVFLSLCDALRVDLYVIPA